jgi:hypothetical protein
MMENSAEYCLARTSLRILNDLRNERIMTGEERAIDAVVRVRGVDLSRAGFGLVVGTHEPVALLVHEAGAMTRQSLPPGGLSPGLKAAIVVAPLLALAVARVLRGRRT